MGAAQEAIMMSLAREALRSLLKLKEPSRRTALFAERHLNGVGERRQSRALDKLRRVNVVASEQGEVTPTSGGRPLVMWRIVDEQAAQNLLKDDTKLSAVLWPSAQPQLPLQDEEGSEAEAAEPEPEPEVTAPADSSAEVLGALAAVLKALQTVGGSLAALHEKVDRTATATTAAAATNLLHGSIAALHARFDAHAIAQLPRLGELEAKQLKEGDILNYHNTHGVNAVRVVSVRNAPGAPICVNVSPIDKPDKIIPLTPKFLSHRSLT